MSDATPLPATGGPAAPAAPEPLLEVDAVSVVFGGVRALSDVSLRVGSGTVHAVIGPNGAGKTTLINLLSGVYRAASGSVRLRGRDLTGLRPDRIAALGLARTYQSNALFPALSVEDNLMLGRHHLTRAGFVASGLSLPAARREDRRHRRRAREIAAFLDLDEVLATPAGALSYGDQKRVDVARALCAEPVLILLDEPVAGMNAEETRRMAETIVDIRASLDLTVIVVEHDMGLVMAISDRVTVLDFGRLIAEGTPAEVQRDPAVIAAYLGDPKPVDAALAGAEPS